MRGGAHMAAAAGLVGLDVDCPRFTKLCLPGYVQQPIVHNQRSASYEVHSFRARVGLPVYGWACLVVLDGSVIPTLQRAYSSI